MTRGNARFYAELQVEMQESGTLQKQAEADWMYHTVKGMREQGKKWYEIEAYYGETFGLTRGAFQTILNRIRRSGKVLP